jgi:flavorubredoxin
MDTRIDEIASGIYRLSTYAPEVAPPAGLIYNVFIVLGDEPLLFHTGKRGMFPAVSATIARVLPLERLRWIAFGHYESDECGAMNEFLAAAPHAVVVHGQTACRVSLNDMADRTPRPLADGEAIDLGGGKRVRYLDTQHIPHGWEAGVLYEESTGTLLCGVHAGR